MSKRLTPERGQLWNSKTRLFDERIRTNYLDSTMQGSELRLLSWL